MNQYNAGTQGQAVAKNRSEPTHERVSHACQPTSTNACSCWTRTRWPATCRRPRKQLTRILERNHAEILASRPWDERRLAYPIKGHKKGLYYLTYFRTEGKNVVEHRARLRPERDDPAHLVLHVDPKLVDAMLAAGPRRARRGAADGQRAAAGRGRRRWRRRRGGAARGEAAAAGGGRREGLTPAVGSLPARTGRLRRRSAPRDVKGWDRPTELASARLTDV